jgi:hypothetical protein
VQIGDARKHLIDNRLGHHGKCQDTLGIVHHTWMSDGERRWRQRGDW